MVRLCSMNIHYRFYGLDYFFESCVDNKISYIEFWLCPQHLYITDTESHINVRSISEKVREYGLKICCICPEQNNPKPFNMATTSRKLQNKSIQYFKEVVNLAEKLNVDKVLFTSGWGRYDQEISIAWNQSIANMSKIAEYAKKRKVRICIEPLQSHESNLVNNIKSMEKYLNEIDNDNVYVAIDCGALDKNNETLSEWFEKFGKKIIHIHYVDGEPTGHLPIGAGWRDIEQDMRDLVEFGYEGVLSFEFAGKSSFINPKAADRDSINRIKNALEKIRKGEKK